MTSSWEFAKGHGTKNDFILLKDRNSLLSLTPARVRQLCDRHAGIGADGVIRIVKAEFVPEWRGDPELWFMDYRNADGSVAEMCGNGLRVLVRYLLEEDMVTGPQVDIATRAGLRSAWPLAEGTIRTAMGGVKVGSNPVSVSVRHHGRSYPAVPVEVGNPHLVIFLPEGEELAALDLRVAPQLDPRAFPEGANVEFAVTDAPGVLRFRVYERGDGETLSCGTGAVAVAAAHARLLGRLASQPARAATPAPADPSQQVFTVHALGGRLTVELTGDQAYLTGPAVIIARGSVVLPE